MDTIKITSDILPVYTIAVRMTKKLKFDVWRLKIAVALLRLAGRISGDRLYIVEDAEQGK